MNLSEFAKKEDLRNFFKGITSQSHREYTEEVFEAAVDAMYDIFIQANAMSKDDCDMYLTTCLGLYMIESFENGDEMVTGIKPK